MNTRVAASVVLIAFLLTAASIGYLLGTSGTRTETVQTTSVVTHTVIIETSGIQATQVSTTCVTSGPTNGVVLRVVANNGSWAGVEVTGESVGFCNNQKQIVTLGPATTNSTGWVSFLEGGLSGIYYLDVNETFWTYRLSIVTRPLATTVAVLDLTSGNVTTRFCYFGNCS